ncbi:transposase IS204/IS1001/IS1096/IS1165 family protein [Caldalkalibacillus thermarum TA2.A1]|uniref:Transposase IS204/IS1001/IS1096/IS1165 family protein n=1 Tax=Caldalkalibacillus thermarum (strain TA2.A1) TaxID=986075 RepID=F5LBC1_CALTT|nr:transposase IS204/IS1001/IS1096/IS1165 family protein [Caldalkalibacillus thermarum TA2.A1]
MDMSPAFIKGATEHFPEAAITFDKFHVIQAAKRKARGYRSDKNIIAMVYLLAGKLKLPCKL